VINVQVNSTDRAFAAELANAVVTAYIETALALRVEPAQKFTQFFDDRAKSAREAVEIAQRRFSAYQQTKGIVVTDERLDIENARLAELSTQLTALQAVASESANRQRLAERQAEVSPEVQASPMLAQLNGVLAQQEARLVELETRLSEQHPQIIELQSSIAQTRAKIRSESVRVVRSLGVPSEVNNSRVEELTTALAGQRLKLLRMKSERDEAAVLQRDVENAQRVYDAAFARLNQSDLSSQSRQSNVALLKTASRPTSASSPKLLVNTVVALVLGTLLGLAAIYVRELADRKMRSADDVLEILGVPMLGTVPRGRYGATARRSRLRMLLGMPARQLQLASK
jgi:succinoglycan biosynthesis transport protein ExoP